MNRLNKQAAWNNALLAIGLQQNEILMICQLGARIHTHGKTAAQIRAELQEFKSGAIAQNHTPSKPRGGNRNEQGQMDSIGKASYGLSAKGVGV